MSERLLVLERWGARLGWRWHTPPEWIPGCEALIGSDDVELGRVMSDQRPQGKLIWSWDLKVPRAGGGVTGGDLATPEEAQTELLATALLERWAHEQLGCQLEFMDYGVIEMYLDGAPVSNSILKLRLRRVSGSSAGGWDVSGMGSASTAWEHPHRTGALAELADGVMSLFDLDGRVPLGPAVMPEPDGAEVDLEQLARTREALERLPD